MFESILGPLISAGSSLLGGLFGQSSKDKDREAQERMAAQNIALQKEFAQSGIRWKVADAKAAGIHPIYALGANTTSFSPVSVGSDPSSPLGEAVGRMGQDIGRAVSAAGSREERTLALAGTKLQLENQQLQNDVLRAKLASDVQKLSQGTGAPFPTIVAPSVKGDDKRTGTNWFGANATVANVPDAQTIQNRFGEPAEWLYFPLVAGADAAVNAWPYVSRFLDATGAGVADPAGWQRTMSKFNRYMDYVRR